MRLLILAGDNSLSHAAKGLALKETLEARGHQALLATGPSACAFYRRVGGAVSFVLPDLSGRDGSSFPTVAWFKDRTWIQGCLRAEADLLRAVRPDLVVGIFRFTARLSALAAGVPFYSLACGCILPECSDVLGFSEDDAGGEVQDDFMRSFFRYGGDRLLRAAGSGGEKGLADARDHLKGRVTFLWDIPEFQPLRSVEGILHVGPIRWGPDTAKMPDLESEGFSAGPLAVVSFGTCNHQDGLAGRVTAALATLGFCVVVAGGGRKGMDQSLRGRRITVLEYPPLDRLLAKADLLVCHGGQLTIFEALASRVPVLVIPFQPEQAQNGVCLERMGCGKRLVASRPFLGNSAVFLEQVASLGNGELARLIEEGVGRIRRDALERAGMALLGYRGAVRVAQVLESQ